MPNSVSVESTAMKAMFLRRSTFGTFIDCLRLIRYGSKRLAWYANARKLSSAPSAAKMIAMSV